MLRAPLRSEGRSVDLSRPEHSGGRDKIGGGVLLRAARARASDHVLIGAYDPDVIGWEVSGPVASCVHQLNKVWYNGIFNISLNRSFY